MPKVVKISKIDPNYAIFDAHTPRISVRPNFHPDYLSSGLAPVISSDFYGLGTVDYSELFYTLKYEVTVTLSEEEFKSIIEEGEI